MPSINPEQSARDLMSSPVRTVRPQTTIEEAQKLLLRYGHSGLPIVNEGRLVGIVSRRDLDLAAYHGLKGTPVEKVMATQVKTIEPSTSLSEIQSILGTYDIGRLPVIDRGQLVGIVTRTDVLRKLQPAPKSLRLERFAAPFQKIFAIASEAAEDRGWHLYLVGGAVRDLLLADPTAEVSLSDIDFVVDGFHRSAEVGAGVELAKCLQEIYPQARLEIHGKFQTAALLWHNDSELGSLWIDIATARTEFYLYPAANPEVEASSIRQDLYRRDFTVNALALRLTNPRAHELLDFFGGVSDLRSRLIRVLHPNSFIEDPTRIYRAVRFAVRLGFEIEPQTEAYIRHAIASGVYNLRDRPVPALQSRLRSELKYILQTRYWKPAIQKLADLDALVCIHPNLKLDRELWQQLKWADRFQRFDLAIPHWQLLLEVLIAKLDDRAPVAKTLQLPHDAIKRLAKLPEIEATLQPSEKPSEMVQRLKPFDSETLALIAARGTRSMRRSIWQYFNVWSHIKPPLDGSDLKALGYKPGKQFKQLLEELLVLALDGEIRDRTDAEQYLSEHYPLN